MNGVSFLYFIFVYIFYPFTSKQVIESSIVIISATAIFRAIQRMSQRLQYVESYFSPSSGRLPCLCHPMTVGGPMDIRQLSFELQHRKQILRRLNSDYCSILGLMRNICTRMGVNLNHHLAPELDLPPFNPTEEQEDDDDALDVPQRPYVKLKKQARPQGTISESRKRQIVRRYAQAARQGMSLARFCLLNQLPQREVSRWISMK